MPQRILSWVLVLLAVSGAGPSFGVTLPTNFQRELRVSPPFTGDPVGFAFLPDERVLIIERSSGRVRLAPVGSLTSSIILTIPDVEAVGAEQGLLGVAVDSAWPARPYVYFYYTRVGVFAYLTMYTATGDLSDPSSGNLTLGSPYHLFTDLPDQVDFHNSGTLRFGPDGMLLVTLGDDGNPCATQNLDLMNGKLLRLDVSSMPGGGPGPPPKSELIPSGNPFSGPGDVRQLIYAWGLRNPFRFTMDPLTGDVVIGDVGFNAQEEVDLVLAADPGDNFGWPQREGYAAQTCCGTCGQENEFTEPIYAYLHDEVLPKAVIAGPLYRHEPGAPHAFPASYDGSIFVSEFYDGWIRRLVDTGSGWEIAPEVPGQPSPLNWAGELPTHSDIQQGPDGALYMLKPFGTDRGLYRIVYSPPVGAPPILAAPAGNLSIEPSPLRFGQQAHVRWIGRSGTPVTLTVQDVSGRVVRTLLLQEMRDAIDVVWDGLSETGNALASGTYFLRLESAGSVLSSAKIVLLR